MDTRFFNKFPLINYNGCNCVNITERVGLIQSVNNNEYIYYPYDLQVYERADQFANRYYGDSYLSWIIYLTNGIYDPIRGWYLQLDDLNQLITQKYGSVQLATQKTKFYRNNWPGVPNIFPNYYDSLPPILQAYWQPVCTGYQITSYERTQIDWTLNTNMIIEYSLVNTSFIIDEIVDIVWNGNTMGQGQVLSINSSSNSIFVQHVNGYYQESFNVPITSNSYVYGQESNINTSFYANSVGGYTNSVIIATNLTPEEDIYWTPITYYEYENENNEANKTLRVLDSRYTTNVLTNFVQLMSN